MEQCWGSSSKLGDGVIYCWYSTVGSKGVRGSPLAACFLSDSASKWSSVRISCSWGSKVSKGAGDHALPHQSCHF